MNQVKVITNVVDLKEPMEKNNTGSVYIFEVLARRD